MRSNRLRFLASIASLLLAPLTAAGGVFPIDVIAFTRQQASDAAVGHLFRDLSVPSITPAGKVAFAATAYERSYESQTAGIWVADGSSLDLVVSNLDDLPGIPGAHLAAPLPFVMHDNGTLSVYAQMNGPGVANELVVMTLRDGTLHLVAREMNDPSWGVPHQFEIVGPGWINSAGQGAFWTENSPIDRRVTLWSYDENGVRQIAAEQQPSPIAPAQSVARLRPQTWISSTGNVTIAWQLQGGGSPWQIVSGPPDALQVRMASGVSAPGVPNATILDFADFQTNDAGDLGLLGRLDGPGVSSVNNFGLWVGQPDDLQLVARVGDPAPGAGAGWHFNQLDYPALTATGDLAFLAHIGGPDVNSENNTGLWWSIDGNLEMVVRAGMPAPGFPEGYKFSRIDAFTINDVGQIAFNAAVAPPPATGDVRGFGTWTVRGDGTLAPLLVSGDLVEVAPGDVRRVSGGIGLHATGNPLVSRVLNNDGTLVGTVRFGDESSAIVTVRLAIPEPTSLAIGCSGVLLLTACGSRRSSEASSSHRVR